MNKIYAVISGIFFALAVLQFLFEVGWRIGGGGPIEPPFPTQDLTMLGCLFLIMARQKEEG